MQTLNIAKRRKTVRVFSSEVPPENAILKAIKVPRKLHLG